MRRNQLIYMGSLVATAIFVSCKGGNVSYMLFYLLLLIPVISILYLIYVYMNLQFYQNTSKRTVVKEEVLPYNVTFQNHSFLPFIFVKPYFFERSSSIGESNKANQYKLLPGEEETLQGNLQCFYRGEYEVGVERIELMDFFGLIKWTYHINWPLKLTVLPKVVSLNELCFAPVEEDSKRTQFSLGNEIDPLDQEVRKYQQGDSIRFVHWKIAAKRRQLWVRQSSSPINRENILMIDLSPVGEEGIDKLEIEDKILETALAVSYFYQARRIRCTVCTLQERIKNFRIETEEDFGMFYKACGNFIFNEGEGISSILEQAIIESEALSFYMIVTHGIAEGLERPIYKMVEKGNQVVILSIGRQPINKAQIKRLEEIGAKICCIAAEETVKQILEGSGGRRADEKV